MIKMYTEADDMSMDIQVGPKTEIEADVETSPVDIAKKNPDTVAVAGKHCEDGVCEFYVDADDVQHFADLNEYSVMEALNAIIACNEDAGMTAQNMIMIMTESTMDQVEALEEAGVTCMQIMGEADDIAMDVQVGPKGDEIRVAEDPQEANPVDAVKRQYNNVVVAKQGDEFFTDVEDVQKCADVNEETIIETLNGIIACNEEAGVTAQNLVILFDEASKVTDKLKAAGAKVRKVVDSAKSKAKERKARTAVITAAISAANDFLRDHDNVSVRVVMANNADFISGKGNKIAMAMVYNTKASSDTSIKANVGIVGVVPFFHYGVNANVDDSEFIENANKNLTEVTKIINKNKKDLMSRISGKLEGKYNATSVAVRNGNGGEIDIVATLEPEEKEEDAE